MTLRPRDNCSLKRGVAEKLHRVQRQPRHNTAQGRNLLCASLLLGVALQAQAQVTRLELTLSSLSASTNLTTQSVDASNIVAHTSIAAGDQRFPQTVAGFESPVVVTPKANGHAIDIYRTPNAISGGVSNTWRIPTYIDNQGAYYSDSWMTLSGSHSSVPDASGHYPVLSPVPSSVPYCLALWTDIDGPALICRTMGAGTNAVPALFMSTSGLWTLEVSDNGTLRWGAGTNRNGFDTSLGRVAPGVLRTPGALSAKFSASDGTPGITATKVFYTHTLEGVFVTNTVTIKNGLITSWETIQ